jgi:hypothetical protein
MYYTGLDPDTLKPVFVPKTQEEKKLQRALLQYRLPKNKDAVNKAYALVKLESPKRERANVKTQTDKPTQKYIRGMEVFRKSLSSKGSQGKNKR